MATLDALKQHYGLLYIPLVHQLGNARSRRSFKVTYYLQLDAEGAHQGIWKFNNTAVERVPPNDYNRNSFPITPGDSVEDTLGKLPEWSNHRFLPTTLAPGEYFPRMARPLFLQKDGHGRPFSPSYKLDEVAIFRGQSRPRRTRKALIGDSIFLAKGDLDCRLSGSGASKACDFIFRIPSNRRA